MLLMFGMGVGTFGTMLGVGGGWLHVPFLMLLFGFSPQMAIGTSHFILCISSFIGTAIYFMLGYVQVDFMMPIAAGTILGAPLGAELARRIDESFIRRALVVLLLFLALKMLNSGFQAMSHELPVIHHLPGPVYPPATAPLRAPFGLSR